MQVHEVKDGYARIEARSYPIERAYPDGYDKEIASWTASHEIATASRRLPCVELTAPHDRRCIAVGGSPSVVRYIEDIRALQQAGGTVVAVNDANNLLQDNGIIPDAMVVFEVGVYPPALGWRCHPDTTFYVASLCHEETFRGLEGHKIIVWHLYSPLPFIQDILTEKFDYPGGNGMMVCGGTTTFMRILPLFHRVLGYRHFECFGFDSSHPEGQGSHFFGTPYYAGKEIEVFLGDDGGRGGGARRRFLTRPIYAQQADEFRQWCLHHDHRLETIHVHGDGLLPAMHRQMFPDRYSEEGFHGV